MKTAAKISIGTPFKLWRPSSPHLRKLETSSTVEGTREDLLRYYKQMFEIRRVEVACDNEYKARRIRGFCHLYDGQEAVAVGVEAVLDRPDPKKKFSGDDWITTYRCHGVAMCRGVTATQVFAEQFGLANGASRGKGGSMHIYRKETNFFGGAAIVGAHVPIAAGLAFANKYRNTPGKPSHVSIAFYGDGAANQGQCWEAVNMAVLWKLPVIFLIENNQYGMGTSTERSSALTEYYKQGGEVVPGIQVNGMDVLAVREAARQAKLHASEGLGPVFIEAKTYRYHGHSMSDPGITYRTKEEVAQTREKRDPIEILKVRMIEAKLATEDELKEIDREIRSKVQAALAEAIASKPPDAKELVTDIYTTGEEFVETDSRLRMRSEFPRSIRMPDRLKSVVTQ